MDSPMLFSVISKDHLILSKFPDKLPVEIVELQKVASLKLLLQK
jgi:hypothetical protein